jgi:hypothetical protein
MNWHTVLYLYYLFLGLFVKESPINVKQIVHILKVQFQTVKSVPYFSINITAIFFTLEWSWTGGNNEVQHVFCPFQTRLQISKTTFIRIFLSHFIRRHGSFGSREVKREVATTDADSRKSLQELQVIHNSLAKVSKLCCRYGRFLIGSDFSKFSHPKLYKFKFNFN